MRIFQPPIRLSGPPPPPDVAALQAELDAAHAQIQGLVSDLETADARRRAALAEQRDIYQAQLGHLRDELAAARAERDKLRDRVANGVPEELAESRWRRRALLAEANCHRYEDRLAYYERRPAQRQQTNDARAVHPTAVDWARPPT